VSLEVLDPGPLTTVQDLGCVGWAHLGVPHAGALDRGAALLANRLVGNAEAAAVLETTVGGLVVRALRSTTVAVTGAEADVRVGGRLVRHGEAVPVRAGSVLEVGAARTGVRSYVAVAGGIGVAPVLGSRSTDTLSWVGPPRLASHQVLPIGVAGPLPRAGDVPRPARRPAHLTVRRGPRADWMDDGSWRRFDGASWTVGSESDRIGLRLVGPRLERATAAELPSEGLVVGAVQLPPSGQPVIFLADHPTTGGYPVVAVLDDADLDRCAQLRPGEELVIRVAPDQD
jgi:biotin-dependent carboxylase-like uncharacterized protein